MTYTPEEKAVINFMKRNKLSETEQNRLRYLLNVSFKQGVEKGIAETAEQKKANQETVWVCPECNCTEVQGSYWIELNSEQIMSQSGSDIWCPQCEDHHKYCELVDKSTLTSDTE